MVIPLTLIVALVAPAEAQPAQSNEALRRFVADLRTASAQDNRPAVAAMMRYPLEVMAGGLKIPVNDATAFVGLYQTIMTPAMKAVIARARVPAAGQTIQGVRVGAGGLVSFEDALVVAPVGGGFRVTRLSVPLGARAAPPGTPVARRLTFRVGRPTQVSGSLDPGGRDDYVFHAVQGAFIDARLSGVPGRSVLLRLVDVNTGEAVDARADAGTRVWTGRVRAASDYRLEVVRQPGSGRDILIYTLAVELK